MLAERQNAVRAQTNLSQDTLKQALTLWAEYFQRPVSNPLAKMYFQKLKHLTDSEFNNAAERCVEELTFFPKIAEILARVPKRDQTPQLNHSPRLQYCQNTFDLVSRYGKRPLNTSNVLGAV